MCVKSLFRKTYIMHTINLGGKAYIMQFEYETTLQKQPFADVFQNRCSYEFRNIHRKTTVLESLLNKVVDLTDCNFIKKRLQHWCFPVNFAKFLRKAFFTKHFWWLLLYFRDYSTRRHRQKKRKET